MELPTLDRLEGTGDGLRFGQVRWGHRVLAFHYDLLSGGVSLFQAEVAAKLRSNPATPLETAAARLVLHVVLPPVANLELEASA